MSTVRTFDQTMIESFLKSTGWRYLTDSDGDYVVQFAYDEDTNCELKLWIIRDGSKKEILAVSVLSDAEIPQAELGAALFFCNIWNKESRWPKTYVVHKEGETHGRITCEGQIDLEQGIHQELLNDFIGTVTSAAHSFWARIAKDRPFTFRR